MGYYAEKLSRGGDDNIAEDLLKEAEEIAKKYETEETAKFINGILGSFVRSEISAE